MSELFLIRHGQASFGAENYDRLSEKGVLQSEILGRHLAAMGVRFDAIYCGRMERQKSTAEGVISQYRDKDITVPKIIIDNAFDEYDSKAVWDSQTAMMLEENPGLFDDVDLNDRKSFQRIFSKVIERWISGEFDSEGVTSWRQFKKQVGQGLNTITKTWSESKKVAVFSSAGAICAIVQKAMDLSDKKTIDLSWQVMNASVTGIIYNNKKISLSGFNNVTHLEMTCDRTLLTYR